jgi:hypothetical protein
MRLSFAKAFVWISCTWSEESAEAKEGICFRRGQWKHRTCNFIMKLQEEPLKSLKNISVISSVFGVLST